MSRRSFSLFLLLGSLMFIVVALLGTVSADDDDDPSKVAAKEAAAGSDSSEEDDSDDDDDSDSDDDDDDDSSEEDDNSSEVKTGGLQPCRLTHLLRRLDKVCPKIRDDEIKVLEDTIEGIAGNMKAIDDIIKQGEESQNLKEDISQIWKDFRGPSVSVLPDDTHLNVVNISVPGELSDCSDAFKKDHKKPGVYLIHPVGSPYKVHLLCVDGWTVIQRRFDGSENFHRSFDEYLSGFGNFSGEFFVGLENLHRMTLSQSYTLRVDVKSAAGKWYFAVFNNFAVSDETDQFRLKLGNMTASNTDDVMDQSRDKPFSTYDRDNDDWSGGNCAQHFRGGWWSGNCITNLNQMWCSNGCLRWGDTRVVSSIMRIRPTSTADPDDMTETPNPVGFSIKA